MIYFEIFNYLSIVLKCEPKYVKKKSKLIDLTQFLRVRNCSYI